MYRLMYKEPIEGRWIVVSQQESLDAIKDIWDSIFWSAMEKRDLGYGGIEKFLRIDNLCDGTSD